MTVVVVGYQWPAHFFVCVKALVVASISSSNVCARDTADLWQQLYLG